MQPSAMAFSFRNDSPEDARFRAEVRAWIDANLPGDLQGLPTRPSVERAMWWHRRLHDRGWIALHWPREHGGGEASLDRQIIVREELARAGAPEISAQGLYHIGPILMSYGTDAQKRRFLPPILSGDELWCQGYSEPGAGSDLASLSTTAGVDGEHLVVTGSKIWTTWAHHADWMFALVRSDPEAPRKQAGLSFVLIDMKAPGVGVRPIRTIAGDDEFAEVFLDGVRVPIENLVGELHDGWRIANALLAHERLVTANPQLLHDALRRTREAALSSGAMDDSGFRDRLTTIDIEVIAFSAMFAHAAEIANSGGSLGVEASLLKISGTELLQKIADLLAEAAGIHSAMVGPGGAEDSHADAAALLLQTRRATIYGGSSEIQRNIIARRILGLPSGS